MSKKLLIAFLLLQGLGSFSGAIYAQQIASEKLENVRYGPFQRNVMDVYLPPDRTSNTPFVILIHGGAWTRAGKEDIRDFQDSLFAHGIAVASINHRYANDSDVHYPEMMQDVDRAVDYCQTQSKKWHTNTKKLVMSGARSGAHLALLYSYTT